MPPKNKRQNLQADDEEEQPLQAVILTDSYDERFLPISHEVPRCLMPLCNIPLIEYTLEMLAISDVQDVFVVCTSHIDKIKSYLENSPWMKSNCPLNVQIVQTPECMSVGDAIRELDARQLITTDFILTSGDLISNMKLDKAIEAHRARKRTDKNSIMTMLLKEASPTHSARAKDDSSIFVMDPLSDRCVHYEAVEALPRKHRIEMSPEVFERRTQIEIRNDLLDPQLDICSVEVPALFTENFDWQHLRKDFVHGILTSDILGKTIYTHVVSDPYIARVQNEQLYSVISKHILNRWVFPIVPETNLKAGDEYEYMRGNIYKNAEVVLSRSCIIDENVQIGKNTVIGENSRVGNSIIGRNCYIGDNVVLEGAFVWDNVVIGNNCKITNSILAHQVTVLEGTTIHDGCLVSVGTIIGRQQTIPKYSKLSLLPQPKTSMFADDSDEENEGEEDQEHVLTGDHEPVYFWSARSNDDDDTDIRNVYLGSLAYDMADLEIADHELSDSASEVGAESDDESDLGSITGAFNLGGAGTNSAKRSEEFKKEIAQTIERSLEENHSVDTAALEITGLRMSSNGTYTEVREVLIPILIDRIDLASPVPSMKKVFTKWGDLVTKVTHSQDDQVHVLEMIQKHCASQSALGKLFLGTLQLLYNMDIIEEDAIMQWYDSEASQNGSAAEIALREKATKFIDWLNEAEEEDSDDE
ncbi:nucleotide-diphospho-sugar transferase [Radiomyces spectabilis]|uniref:nucleotide-diphospho-sugar transferase n=1 Tax=Radiomyces spectabilis TaxID=64574 RepID=UPI002220686B|nr:nucleotide-diphospho-sugar transferase [Radiomyces spectabilis]KAI8369361.1 nucleotide-diphospho-sugar transferase [Radiomyces spectabilis]